MLSVFILCAGDGARWNNYLEVPKQLITFGGETLIQRTVRLIEKRKAAGIVYCVARDSRVSLLNHETLVFGSTDSIAETVLTTRPYWSDRNVFLLGDVFYSDLAVARLLESRRALTFGGRPWPSSLVKCGHGEMFSLKFESQCADRVCNLLRVALSCRLTLGYANLWILYQLAAGLPLGSSQYLPELLLLIDDYTNDIDTPIDYHRRRELYETVALCETGARPVIVPVIQQI